MANQKYVIGVDAGGSHTVAIAYSLTGEVLQRVQTGSANLTVEANLGLKNIHDAVCPLLSQHSAQACQQILIGIAGLGAYPAVKQLPQKLGLGEQNIQIINDAQLAQLAKLQRRDGLLVLVGTGSIIMGSLAGKQVRVGGWGHLLGDEGSGYQLGQLAVRQVTLEHDAGELSLFSNQLLAEVDVTSTSALVGKFYQWEKRQVAALAPFVLDAASAEDVTATKIVQQTVAGLVTQIELAVQLSHWPVEKALLVALFGSIVEKSAYYRLILQQQLQQAGLTVNILPINQAENNASAVLYLNHGQQHHS